MRPTIPGQMPEFGERTRQRQEDKRFKVTVLDDAVLSGGILTVYYKDLIYENGQWRESAVRTTP